jgi:hypothetical protein
VIDLASAGFAVPRPSIAGIAAADAGRWADKVTVDGVFQAEFGGFRGAAR